MRVTTFFPGSAKNFFFLVAHDKVKPQGYMYVDVRVTYKQWEVPFVHEQHIWSFSASDLVSGHVTGRIRVVVLLPFPSTICLEKGNHQLLTHIFFGVVCMKLDKNFFSVLVKDQFQRSDSVIMLLLSVCDHHRTIHNNPMYCSRSCYYCN